jgi:hypothetical protein
VDALGGAFQKRFMLWMLQRSPGDSRHFTNSTAKRAGLSRYANPADFPESRHFCAKPRKSEGPDYKVK